MIEKQLRKPLTENELFKTAMIEIYPLHYIDLAIPKKIQIVPKSDYTIERTVNDHYSRTEKISTQERIDEVIDEINKIWHVGGTVILMYQNKKLKGYKTDVPFKYLKNSVKKMI